ncbi:MAG: hypothetical protein J3R72DRAFT_426240 [Linnemannia gamsii]|nr:MAG: hypothetical protein J3R72DRAFT_426240 [Linnemannia gamsii]
MYNAYDFLSDDVDRNYETISCSNTIPFDNYNFLDTSAQNNFDSLCQQSGDPHQFLYNHLAHPIPQSSGGVMFEDDGSINSYQSLLHDEPSQNVMKRLIDSLFLKDDPCDTKQVKRNPPEDWPVASDGDEEFNPISMEANAQEIPMETNPQNSNDHEEAITNLGKHIVSLQYGSTVYRVINDNEPGRLRFPHNGIWEEELLSQASSQPPE